jgi:hypothetical protein
MKKIGGRKSHVIVLLRQVFGFHRNTPFLVDLEKNPELRKKDKKVAELAEDWRELRNCGSQILKVHNRRSAILF